MKTIQFSSIGGASGDMILGALIGLGVDLEILNSQLSKLLPDEHYHIIADPVNIDGITGIRAKVVIGHHHHHDHEHHEHEHHEHHELKHEHEHEHHEHHELKHEHEHEHKHEHHHHDHHEHRGLIEITNIINSSDLPEAVKDMALKVFTRLAEAEAEVHGTTPEKIHFHEVGAIDSIVDIVGCCLALNMLGIDKVGLGALPVGCGTVKCQHGILPVPAPATVKLLRGMEIIQTDEPFEMVTPTGAVLLSTWKNKISGGTMLASANSFGHRKLNHRANLLRAVMYDETGNKNEAEGDSCTVLECNLDDCTPEIIGGVYDLLFEAGALEVFSQPVHMKKNRQGILLTVICDNAKVTEMEELIFRETSTFGIRRHRSERRKLSREIITIDSEYGRISVKIGSLSGKIITVSPEYEDCKQRAAELNIPVKDVYAAAIAASRTIQK